MQSAPALSSERTDWVAAFEAMVRDMRPALLRFFVRRTGSSAVAEELTQELFMRLLRRPDLFQMDSVEGYVFEAAANLARDQARRDAARGGGRHVQIETEGLPMQEPDAERVVESRKRLKAVLGAIERLPPRTRDVLMLRRFENMSYAQIAARLGISVSAVEKQMVKGMAALEQLR
jgi:RNA polymerase sigma factor (sigma-70 family)